LKTRFVCIIHGLSIERASEVIGCAAPQDDGLDDGEADPDGDNQSECVVPYVHNRATYAHSTMQRQKCPVSQNLLPKSRCGIESTLILKSVHYYNITYFFNIWGYRLVTVSAYPQELHLQERLAHLR
jgi:hypothetical protein